MPCTVLPHLTEYDARLIQVVADARRLPDQDLAQLSADSIVEALTDEYGPPPVAVHIEEEYLDYRDSRPGYQELRLIVPVSGCALAIANNQWRPFPLELVPRDGSYIIIAHVREIDLKSPEDSYRDLEPVLERMRSALRTLAESANKEIDVIRERMRWQVREIVEQRRRGAVAFYSAADALGIPVGPRPEGARIELRPRRITLKQLQDAVARGEKEWHLAEEIAEDIIAMIMSFNVALERLVATADKLAGGGEETIRDLLLFILNANYVGLATGETFTGDGKTDILLRWRNQDAFIGECKIWDGSEHFAPALNQLLDKYTVWRDTRVALIVFIRDRVDVGAIIEKAHACVAEFSRTRQIIQPQEPDKRRDYLIGAASDEQRIVRLSLLPVVIPRPS